MKQGHTLPSAAITELKVNIVTDTLSFRTPEGRSGYVIAITEPRKLADDLIASIARSYNAFPTALSLLLRLQDAVEALDGTSVENEALVDEYRAFLKDVVGNS